MNPEGNWLSKELRNLGVYEHQTPLVELKYENHVFIKGRVLGGVEGQSTQFEQWLPGGKRLTYTIYDQWITGVMVLENHVDG